MHYNFTNEVKKKKNRTMYEVHVTHKWPMTVQSSRLNEAGHLS